MGIFKSKSKEEFKESKEFESKEYKVTFVRDNTCLPQLSRLTYLEIYEINVTKDATIGQIKRQVQENKGIIIQDYVFFLRDYYYVELSDDKDNEVLYDLYKKIIKTDKNIYIFIYQKNEIYEIIVKVKNKENSTLKIHDSFTIKTILNLAGYSDSYYTSYYVIVNNITCDIFKTAQFYNLRDAKSIFISEITRDG